MTRTRVSPRTAAMIPAPRLMTADDLYANPLPDARTELVRGRLIVREPARLRHGDVAARVLIAISEYLAADRRDRNATVARGRVVAAETGFTLQRNPDTVRAPDVAYIRADRWPVEPETGYVEFAPDLVVEVRSPSDRPGALLAKVADWLSAGTLLVWTIDPKRRTARVYRADGTETELTADDALVGENVLPGFRERLSTLVD